MTDKTMREKVAEHLIAYSYWLTSHYESVGQNALEADRRAGAILDLKVASVPCETCAGTGKRIKMLDRHFTNRCPDCEGHGTIGIPLSELIEKHEGSDLLRVKPLASGESR